MKKILTAIIISIIALGFSFKLDFSLIGYLTYDLNSGNLDNFPIAYWTLTLPEPLNSFSIRAIDYLSYSHGITNIAGYNVIVPRYYFVDTRFDWNNLRVNFQNATNTWVLMTEVGYNFNQFYLGVFMKENSVWLANGYIPLYGLKFKVGDLSISLANGDLSSTFTGDQNMLIQLIYNYKASVDFVQAINSITLPFQSKISTSSEEGKVKIANLYTMPEGSKVTTTGIVLAPTGLLSSATTYIQDETGAIMLYGKSIPTNLRPGDLVSVSGTTKVYNGVLEIVVDSITKIGTQQPKAVETKKVEMKHLSNLVKVQGRVKNVSKDTIIIDTGEAEIKIFVKSTTGISLSEIKQGMKLTVTGIVSLYKDELEILPMYQEDIVIEK